MEQYERGVALRANRKLERIIEREGDADGLRRDPDYIARLRLEILQQDMAAFQYAIRRRMNADTP